MSHSNTPANPNTNSSNNSNPNANSNPNDTSQVLIAGGGHVGLSFALLLAYQGIRSTVIEKNSYPKISPDDDSERRQYLDSRNTALSRRTVQIYQTIGLWDDLASHACRIDEVHISEMGSFGHAKLKKEEEGVESFGQVMENAWLGRKLLLAVQASELITVMDGTEVTTVEQDNSSVTIHIKPTVKQTDVQNSNLQDTELATNTLTASLLVACDGRDSVVRELLGIGTSVYDYQQTGIVGVVTTDQPHNHVGIERFSPAGPLAVLPLSDVDSPQTSNENNEDNKDNEEKEQLKGYRRSVVWICPKGEEQRYLEDDEYFLQTLQETFGERAGKFLQAGRRGAYPLTKVLAERQVQGRCVIMGNSAHTLHPVAGQGFNLCMRDADTLAKMLKGLLMRTESSQADESQLQGQEPEQVKAIDFGNAQLLHSYEQTRKKDQKRVIKFCDAVVLGFTHPSPVVKFTRNLGLLAFDKLPNIKPLVATYAMGLKS